MSRQTFYKWARRYRAQGDVGLCDQSKSPHLSPKATSPDVVRKILYLRENYHFGPGRIRNYLQRYHSIRIAQSSVHRNLQRHNLNRLPANRCKYEREGHKWKRYEKQQPGHRVQVDVKFLERIPGSNKRFYQYTAIDDCTRMRVLKIYDKHNQTTAIAFLKEVIDRLPFRIAKQWGMTAAESFINSMHRVESARVLGATNFELVVDEKLPVPIGAPCRSGRFECAMAGRFCENVV